MKPLLIFLIFLGAIGVVEAVSMSTLLGKKSLDPGRKNRRLKAAAPKKGHKKSDVVTVRAKAKPSKKSKKSQHKPASASAPPMDRFLKNVLKAEAAPLPSLKEDISELNKDLRKIEDEKKQKEEEERQQQLAAQRAREDEQARSLKLEAETKQKNKKHSKQARALRERRRLMSRFRSLDTPDQIAKLKSIYKSYGIEIKDLTNKDLRFLIKNTKRLLKMYYDPANAMSGFGERGLGDQRGGQGDLQQMIGQQLYGQQQTGPQLQQGGQMYAQPTGGVDPRQLQGPSPAMSMAKGSGDSVYANRAAGGDMSIKFPDSPPVVVTNQMPYYSN